MQKTQGILVVFILILLVMIFYSYWSGTDLGWWLKGWVVVCAAVFIVRLAVKYRKKQ